MIALKTIDCDSCTFFLRTCAFSDGKIFANYNSEQGGIRERGVKNTSRALQNLGEERDCSQSKKQVIFLQAKSFSTGLLPLMIPFAFLLNMVRIKHFAPIHVISVSGGRH